MAAGEIKNTDMMKYILRPVNGAETYEGSVGMDVWKLPLHPINLSRADKSLLSGRRIHSGAVVHVLQLLTNSWPEDMLHVYHVK